MYKGDQVKRSRRGGRRPQHSNHNQNGGGGGNNGGGNNYNPNRTFDSTGPDVKIRGSASHVYEKYLQLARDANTSGDRVMAENYLQHAEHYYRILATQQAHQQQYQQQRDSQQQQPAYQNGKQGQPQEETSNGASHGSSAPTFDLTEQPDIAVSVQESDESVPENEGF